MAKDFAFMFMPGDYLRDTQCLSEKAQVAYDRIMCEHMRNICISYDQHKFFTKRLNDDEKEELNTVLKKIEGGFQIEWVALSIIKRNAYSESRRSNRGGKNGVHMSKISKSYDPHMEDEDEIDNKNIIYTNEKKGKKFKPPNFDEVLAYCRERNNQVDSQAFIDHYESNGWKVGKNQMKNWKASVRTWERSTFGGQNGKNQRFNSEKSKTELREDRNKAVLAEWLESKSCAESSDGDKSFFGDVNILPKSGNDER